MPVQIPPDLLNRCCFFVAGRIKRGRRLDRNVHGRLAFAPEPLFAT